MELHYFLGVTLREEKSTCSVLDGESNSAHRCDNWMVDKEPAEMRRITS